MRKKLILRIGFLLFVLFVITVGMVSIFFRRSVISAEEERAVTIAEIVKDALVSYMVLNMADKRDLFLQQIRDTEGLLYLRVLRGESVIKQYGKGSVYELPQDDLEKKALKLGSPLSRVIETPSSVVYQMVIPLKASSMERINCMQCHEAREGEVLGAISLGIDLTQRRREALTLLGIYSSVAGLAVFLIFFAIVKHFEPYRRLFKDIKRVLNNFKEGNFHEKVETELEDEAGEIAGVVNDVGNKLDKTLSNIREKVSMLIGYNVLETENALKDTEKIVDELVKISNFKRTIEQDLTKQDIFTRIEMVLSEYMALDKFSIYEIDDRKNHMKVVTVAGEKLWCSEVILENANECRAKRTGEDVDSVEFPCICPRFAYNDLCSSQGIQYFCIPVNIGGKVGVVVQIVYEKEMDMFIRMIIPYIKGYLQEASPVLESKSLMELLKQQSYIDQLTGLYNRRFLEEIADKITAQVKRRGTNIGLLMIDIDHFKQVNDQYGHDVGDRVLKEIAETIKSNVREADYVVRFGGEEILVLLMDVKEGESVKVAEKLRKAVENKVINISGGYLKKTVSIGVSEFPRDCEGMFWKCIKFADVALYKAKEAGRNRVVKFSPEMWTGEEY